MTTLGFAEAARRLGEGARGAGCAAPSFRSPSRVAGVRRSIQRRTDGTATVAVTVKGRPQHAVLADMIDGVIMANRLEPAPASELRDRLWELLSTSSVEPVPSPANAPANAPVTPIRAA